jgi:undecaprenyl-diphosphatase
MEWWQAVVLGVVEGVTEFLPVSSTGHLILAQRAMGIAESEAADAYAVCIQAGAILAVLGLYARHVYEMCLGLLGRNPEGLRLFLKLFVAFLPAAVIGLLLAKTIKKELFGLWPVVGAWFVGGVLILVVEWPSKPRLAPPGRLQRGERRTPPEGQRGLQDLTLSAALIIGFFQCLALWPGTSRSLVTILGGLAVGLTLDAAVEFSFLLGVGTLLAATGHDAVKHGRVVLDAYSWSAIVIGFVVAALTAAAAVTWMVHYLRRHGLAIFGYYRIGLAIIVGGLIVLERLSP